MVPNLNFWNILSRLMSGNSVTMEICLDEKVFRLLRIHSTYVYNYILMYFATTESHETLILYVLKVAVWQIDPKIAVGRCKTKGMSIWNKFLAKVKLKYALWSSLVLVFTIYGIDLSHSSCRSVSDLLGLSVMFIHCRHGN